MDAAYTDPDDLAAAYYFTHFLLCVGLLSGPTELQRLTCIASWSYILKHYILHSTSQLHAFRRLFIIAFYWCLFVFEK